MGDSLRYLRAGLLGTVNAASGDTRLYLAPGADSLAAAWARLLAPLIRPLDSLPRALRTQLPFPARTFRTATALADRWRSDTTIWGRRPREPFEVVAPTIEGAPDAPRVWMGQAFEAGSTLAALVTFSQPAAASAPTGIDTVFLSWGEHRGQGRSVGAALRNLLASGGNAPAPADTALAARWRQAQRLAARADAALAAGDLERFGQLYAQLKELLGLGRRKLAPAPERR